MMGLPDEDCRWTSTWYAAENAFWSATGRATRPTIRAGPPATVSDHTGCAADSAPPGRMETTPPGGDGAATGTTDESAGPGSVGAAGPRSARSTLDAGAGSTGGGTGAGGATTMALS